MARPSRIDLGDYIYHVINRANDRTAMFKTQAEYADFEYLLNEIRETFDMRILAYCIMPNHWHLVLYPQKDGDLSKSLHWLTTSHVRRHHSRHGTIGHGHLYQGTYKSFLVQDDNHFLTVLKYVERNAVRAKLSKEAEGWRWGSSYRRLKGTSKEKQLLAELPVDLPRDYQSWINEPEPAEELKEVRFSVEKGFSYGSVTVPNIITQ